MTERHRKMTRREQEAAGLAYDPRRLIAGGLIYLESSPEDRPRGRDELAAALVEAIAAMEGTTR